MAKVRLACLMGSFIIFSLQSQAMQLEGDPIFNDPGYYQLGSVEIFDSTPQGVTEIPKGIGAGICGSATPPSVSPMSTLAITGPMLDTIVNIGKALWDMIQSNKAVVDIKIDASTAIPKGLGCWTDLGNFSNARAEYKTILIKNFAGMRAVEFQYRTIFLPGGSYKNKGKYIGYATMVPSNVYVIAGWKFTAQATTPAVYNLGSATAPVGAINMNMVYRAESTFSTTEKSESYQIDGEGNFREL